MAKAKRKALPKDFDQSLKTSDLDTLETIFEKVDVNARGGVFKQSALAFNECPDELARWLVEQGADIDFGDNYGETPLHARAGHWQGNIAILLELGADVNHDAGGRATPLHRAAETGNLKAANLLIDHGADPNAKNSQGQSPLVFALQRCSNTHIERLAPMAERLLRVMPVEPEKNSFVGRIFGRKPTSPSAITDEMRELVKKIGANFEFHRAGFNPQMVDAVSNALDRLYSLFDVPPVARRAMHDGKSDIVASAASWQEQHQELWEMLVPSSGAASTVQGEVIRISGRISDELERNGGANWNADYRMMADALLTHVASGNALPSTDLDAAKMTVSEVKSKHGDPAELCRHAVNWVALNPKPVELKAPPYHR